jgi:hypothetical protein
MTVAIQCPAGPGKRNLLARGEDGCHEWTDRVSAALSFRDNAEATAYADSIAWLRKYLANGMVVLTSAERGGA